MRLSCPSCKTTFEIPKGSATAGKKVRCARCKNVFRVPGESRVDPTPATPVATTPPADEITGSQRTAGPPPDEISGSQRTAFEDMQAAAAEDPDADAGWGEPELGDPSDLDHEPRLDDGPAPDAFGEAAPTPEIDPFASVDNGTPAETVAEPEPPAPEESAAAGSVGVSAIRAQSGAAAAVGETDEDVSGAWLLRLSDGVIRNFDSMEEVHTYLGANPDEGAEVSSDGRSWQDPASLRSMQAPRPGPREPTGLSVALRAAAAPMPSDGDGAGAGWSLLALLTTLLMLASVAVALQTLQVLDLSAWVPFDAVGLEAIASARPVPGDEVVDSALLEREAYETLMGTATRARKAGQLVDAAIAYQRAVDTLESPEALEALAEVYETLGEGRRARKVRARLGALREKRGKRTP